MSDREARSCTKELAVVVSLCLGGLVVAGCDGRPVGLGDNVADGGTSDPPPDQRVTASDQTPKQDKCVVGINWAACCPTPKPMLESELAGCIQRYPSTSDHSHCKPPTMICPAVACAIGRPRSHMVQMGADGHCTWKSECQQHGDCRLAVDLRVCCSGWEGYPARLLESDPCLYVPGKDVTKCTGGCTAPSCASWPPASMPIDTDYGPFPYCWDDDSDLGLRKCGLGPV